MKKIYMMVAILGASSLAFSQVAQKPVAFDRSIGYTEASAVNNGDKTLFGNTDNLKSLELFTSNFEDESDWIINDSPLGEINWEITGSSFSGYTFSNGFEVPSLSQISGENIAKFDFVPVFFSAGAPAYSDQESWMEIAEPIDCSEIEKVVVSFDQIYAAYNFDITYLEYTTDGGDSWNSIELNGSVGPIDLVQSNEDFVLETDNAEEFSIRFRHQALYNDAFDDNFQGGLIWQIGNVKITEVPDNDIKLITQYFGQGDEGLTYYQIPLKQMEATGVKGSARVLNQGNAGQTNVQLIAKEVNAGYEAETSPVDIDSEDGDSLVITNLFKPEEVGSYTMSYEIVADEEDDNPGNNQMKDFNFQVTDYVYALDYNTQAEQGVILESLSQDASSGGLIVKYANAYEIMATQEVTGVSFQFGPLGEMTEGAEVAVSIVDENINLIPGTDGTFSGVNPSTDENKLIDVAFDNPVTLTPGLYYAIVEPFGEDFSISSTGKTDTGATMFQTQDEEGWSGFIGGTPVFVIRLNFDPELETTPSTVSVNNEELTIKANTYPNPMTVETTVTYSLEESANVSYTVTDMAGQVVFAGNEGNKVAGNHNFKIDGASFANGMYFINLKADNHTYTQKLVVNK